ncbi:exosortase E/protease, VPEID-CTERM system [Shimia sp. MMG029]|uniref:exosortase E/protease, VPEID-CTERM system n=1 Tax=Shimia sp. MMG029 TaxID=3021978 RepID=UPI0022FDE409|nr:exosortase E/protease, VPEID-CTERM system [Shimia sp. MMG029]MDA5557285.1 exosortase E/protease, VPEID-CTERM system [Shimia sp. MMG029]
MTGPDLASSPGPSRPARLTAMIALAVAELLLVIIAYQVMASIECRLTEVEAACRAVRSMTARGLSILTVMAIYFWLRPDAYRSLTKTTGDTPGNAPWIWVHFAGLALIFAPLALFGVDEINRSFLPTLLFMGLGSLFTILGGLFWVTPLQSWRSWMRSDSYLLPFALLLGFLVPDLANLIRPVWEWSTLSSLTFFLVFLTLVLFGFQVSVDPPTYVIGIEDFFVQIASQCSGVEGIALITIFMGFYALLMRPDLRQKRFWLILYPLAVFTSWLFNILRISVLIIIGARISPEHALNGFHSYAGWLMFTALALGVVVVAHQARWLHRTARPRKPSTALRADPLSAQIIPFIVMMLSGVIVSAFWPTPAEGYPLRTALMAAALLYFLPALRGWCALPSKTAIATGCAIGVLWIVTAPVASATSNTPAPDALWIALRLIGTILLVPLIEELFFRGYILRRLNRDGLIWTVIAVTVSSILFGLLHDRILAGTLAGIAFGCLYLQRKRLADPIAAHMIANALIAIMALLTEKWALI